MAADSLTTEQGYCHQVSATLINTEETQEFNLWEEKNYISTQAFVRGTLLNYYCLSRISRWQIFSNQPEHETVNAGVSSISHLAHSEIHLRFQAVVKMLLQHYCFQRLQPFLLLFTKPLCMKSDLFYVWALTTQNEELSF